MFCHCNKLSRFSLTATTLTARLKHFQCPLASFLSVFGTPAPSGMRVATSVESMPRAPPLWNVQMIPPTKRIVAPLEKNIRFNGRFVPVGRDHVEAPHVLHLFQFSSA